MASPAEWPAALRDRPVCPKRGLPVPYIAEMGEDGIAHFTVLDRDKQGECLRRRLCAMCGGPMGQQVALVGDEVALLPGQAFIEPPVHEVCAVLAVGGLCPFLSRERVPRRPVGEDMTVIGTERDTLHEVGRSVAKRPVVVAVCQGYAAVLQGTDRGSPVLVYRAQGVLRVRRFEYVDGRLAEVAAEPQRCPVAGPVVVRAQPRRLSRSKRRTR